MNTTGIKEMLNVPTTILISTTGLLQTFINWTMPVVQWLIAVGTLIFITLQIILKVKKLRSK